MNKEKSLVSIILPTYNVERYLDQCIKSIVEQSYPFIEVIIVIDGATDHSYAIAREWEKKDARVHVLYQDNAGSGPARNTGLKNATGGYIMFVDPDDWIDQDMIRDMIAYQEMHAVDLLITTDRTVDIDGKIIIAEKTVEEIIIDLQSETRKKYLSLLGDALLGAPTRKLYRKSLIDQFDIRFPDLRRSQDIVFNYRYYDCISSVGVLDKAYYNYRIDRSSYNSKLKKDYYLIIDRIFCEILELHKKWGVSIEKREISKACSYLFRSIVANIEADIVRGDDISDIIEDDMIRYISRQSRPVRPDDRLMRYGIEHKWKRFLALIIHIKIFIKRSKIGVKR